MKRPLPCQDDGRGRTPWKGAMGQAGGSVGPTEAWEQEGCGTAQTQEECQGCLAGNSSVISPWGLLPPWGRAGPAILFPGKGCRTGRCAC